MLLRILRKVSYFFRNSLYAREVISSMYSSVNNSNNINIDQNGEFFFIKIINSLSTLESLVIDCGFNHGEYSSRLMDTRNWLPTTKELGFQGNLIAIDPLQSNLDHGFNKLSKASQRRTTLIRTAVSDREGTTEFFSNLDPDKSGLDSIKDLSSIGSSNLTKRVEVPCTTVDTILKRYLASLAPERSVDLIHLKIDVEGAEFAVLLGTMEYLNQMDPGIHVVQFEFGHAARAFNVYFHSIYELLIKANFSVFILKQKELQSILNPFFIENDYSYGNFVAIKNSRLAMFSTYIRS